MPVKNQERAHVRIALGRLESGLAQATVGAACEGAEHRSIPGASGGAAGPGLPLHAPLEPQGEPCGEPGLFSCAGRKIASWGPEGLRSVVFGLAYQGSLTSELSCSCVVLGARASWPQKARVWTYLL